MQWWFVNTVRDGKLVYEDIYASEEDARATCGMTQVCGLTWGRHG